MARSAIPLVTLSRPGVSQGSATASDATGKHYLATNDGRTILMIVSTDAGTQTVSIEIATLVDGQAVTPKVITVAAGATILSGPFPIGNYNQLAIAASGLLTSDATSPANNDTVTIDSQVCTFKTTLSEAKASATLTSDATSPTTGDTVTIDTKVYTFRTTLTEVKASATLTSDATSPANNDTVTIDTHVYTFKTALTGAADEVLINGSAANALINLKKAINLTGIAGTDYGTGTAAHTTVDAGAITATTLLLTSKIVGTGSNSYASTETSAHLSFGGATFAGGVNAIANEVLINGSAANALINLKKAINLTGVSGTDYSTGTTVHTTVDAGTITSTTLLLTAKVLGISGNAYASTETSTHLSFGGATFAGGVNAIANEVLIGGSAANALSNLKKAINASGVIGTDYSTNTVIHPTVSAGTLSSTTLALSAKTAGAAGDTLATTETSAHLSFGAATLVDGFDDGVILIDPSVSATLALRAFIVPF